MEKGEQTKSNIAAVKALIRANEERLARTRDAMAAIDAHLHLTEDPSLAKRADGQGS